MTHQPARPWRRLVPLFLLVLLVHVGALGWLEPREQLRPVEPPVASFATRMIAPPPTPQPALPVVVAEATATPAQLARPALPARRLAAAPAPMALAASPAPETAPAPAPAPAPANPAPAPAPAPEPAQPAARSPADAAVMKVAAAGPATRPAPAPAASTRPVLVPPPARFHYDVALQAKGISLRGQGELAWAHDGRQYEAKLEVSNPLLPRRVQRSTGRITEDGLAPDYFLDKGRSEQAAHFDRDKGRVIFSNNRPPADLQAGLQDRLSVLMQLAALVGGQPSRFKPGTEIAIPTASTRETEEWVFAVEAEEDLRLPGGPVRALKLHRKPRKEFDQRLELWLAPGMDYAPVRVRLTNPNGDTVDQRWSSTDKG